MLAGQRGYPEPINRYGYQHNINHKPEAIVCGLMAASNPIFYRAWLKRRMLAKFESMGTLSARLLKAMACSSIILRISPVLSL